MDYTGLITGAWLTANYQIKPSLQSYIRVENLQGRHDLVGANAALIAGEAEIGKSTGTSYRVGLGGVWLLPQGIRLSAEYHQQHIINQKITRCFWCVIKWICYKWRVLLNKITARLNRSCMFRCC